MRRSTRMITKASSASRDRQAGSRRSFVVTADARRVVYMADQEVDQRSELFSVPLDGSAPATKLNGPLTENGDVERFEVSPDAAHVVFLANQPVAGPRVLYSAPTAGDRPARQISALRVFFKRVVI